MEEWIMDGLKAVLRIACSNLKSIKSGRKVGRFVIKKFSGWMDGWKEGRKEGRRETPC